jgi:hypothetical protein
MQVVKGKWDTTIFPSPQGTEIQILASYNSDVPTEKADREGFSLPVSIRRQIAMKYLHTMARNDSERFDALERVGFNVERYGDITHVVFDRLGGHYMDVGTSAKISQGLVGHKCY